MVVNQDKYKRLRDAVEHSRHKLAPFRKQRVDAIRQYVGQHYSENGSEARVPVNLIELAVSVFVRSLVAKNPRANVTTYFPELKVEASNMSLALDYLFRKIDLYWTLRLAVTEAMFSIGIVKLGVADDGASGMPFVDYVSVDDFVVDMTASDLRNVAFCGNKYRVPLDEAKNNDLFNKAARARLAATDRSIHNEFGDERAEGVSVDGSPVDDIEDQVDLYDIWLPRDRLLVTYAAETGADEPPLRVVEWDGPDDGPYCFLGFNIVPGNVMPLPPTAVWQDLHSLVNILFRKLGSQSEREKTILGVQAGADGDANRIVNASDGEAVRMDNPDKAKEYRFGGINAQTLAMAIQGKDIFSWASGNLDTLGGLSSQSDTLGQEQMLGQNASKRLADMSDLLLRFVTQITTGLAYYLWTDPEIVIPLVRRVPGTDISVPFLWGPEERRNIQFFDYNFSIRPYSMTAATPTAKVAMIKELMGTVIAPMLPMMQEQGLQVDMEALLKIIAKYSDLDEITDIIVFGGESQYQDRQAVTSPSAPSFPKVRPPQRRVNIPGANRAGKDSVLMQTLMGGNPQPKEMGALTR